MSPMSLRRMGSWEVNDLLRLNLLKHIGHYPPFDGFG
jgi:hypothetical protein